MFSIFIPGRHRNDNAILHEVGAGWALDPSVTAKFLDVDLGPNGEGGKLVYFDSRRRMSPYQVVKVEMESQVWAPAAPVGDSPAGRYWLGLPKDHRPTPDDLQRETIIYGESENKTFSEIIEAGSTLGWHTFDQSLIAAYQAGSVTEETVMLCCTNKGRVRRELDLIQKRNGTASIQAPSGLKLNIPEPIRIIDEDSIPFGSPPPLPGKR
jgi:hypothetical protein